MGHLNNKHPKKKKMSRSFMILALVAMMVAAVAGQCTNTAKTQACAKPTPTCVTFTASKNGATVQTGACSTATACAAASKAAQAGYKYTCGKGTDSAPDKACMVGIKCTGGAASVTMSAMAVIAAVFAFMK